MSTGVLASDSHLKLLAQQHLSWGAAGIAEPRVPPSPGDLETVGLGPFEQVFFESSKCLGCKLLATLLLAFIGCSTSGSWFGEVARLKLKKQKIPVNVWPRPRAIK